LTDINIISTRLTEDRFTKSWVDLVGLMSMRFTWVRFEGRGHKIVIIFTWVCKCDYNIYKSSQVIQCENDNPTESEINNQIKINDINIFDWFILPKDEDPTNYQWTRKLYIDKEHGLVTKNEIMNLQTYGHL